MHSIIVIIKGKEVEIKTNYVPRVDEYINIEEIDYRVKKVWYDTSHGCDDILVITGIYLLLGD